jgi:spore coat protein JB
MPKYGGIILDRTQSNTNYRFGSLPDNAPLAVAYVPLQECVTPSYDSIEALTMGTLFPGLDLPLLNQMNVVGEAFTNSPLVELMAIDFVTDELELYLDTHSSDSEAFSMYQSFLALGKEARSRYTKQYGPISQSDMLNAKSYTWLKDPWPWEYNA